MSKAQPGNTSHVKPDHSDSHRLYMIIAEAHNRRPLRSYRIIHLKRVWHANASFARDGVHVVLYMDRPEGSGLFSKSHSITLNSESTCLQDKHAFVIDGIGRPTTSNSFLALN